MRFENHDKLNQNNVVGVFLFFSKQHAVLIPVLLHMFQMGCFYFSLERCGEQEYPLAIFAK